jgi:hypothetical protein
MTECRKASHFTPALLLTEAQRARRIMHETKPAVRKLLLTSSPAGRGTDLQGDHARLCLASLTPCLRYPSARNSMCPSS